jgi:hypothetical protein
MHNTITFYITFFFKLLWDFLSAIGILYLMYHGYIYIINPTPEPLPFMGSYIDNTKSEDISSFFVHVAAICFYKCVRGLIRYIFGI